jgi:hypothetical protein
MYYEQDAGPGPEWVNTDGVCELRVRRTPLLETSLASCNAPRIFISNQSCINHSYREL